MCSLISRSMSTSLRPIPTISCEIFCPWLMIQVPSVTGYVPLTYEVAVIRPPLIQISKYLTFPTPLRFLRRWWWLSYWTSCRGTVCLWCFSQVLELVTESALGQVPDYLLRASDLVSLRSLLDLSAAYHTAHHITETGDRFRADSSAIWLVQSSWFMLLLTLY